MQGEQAKPSYNRGRSRGAFRGRGRGRMSTIQRIYCKKYGHKESEFWSKENQAQYVEEEEYYFFMTYVSPHAISNEVWYLDSACSNHVTGDKKNFKDLDETQKSQVKLGDGKQVTIEGKGDVAVTSDAKIKKNSQCTLCTRSHSQSAKCRTTYEIWFFTSF